VRLIPHASHGFGVAVAPPQANAIHTAEDWHRDHHLTQLRSQKEHPIAEPESSFTMDKDLKTESEEGANISPSEGKQPLPNIRNSLRD
jgi:hypothetical protein